MTTITTLKDIMENQKEYKFTTDKFDYANVSVKGKKEKNAYVTGYISVPEVDIYNDLVTINGLKSMLRQIESSTVTIDFEHEAWRDDNSILPVAKIVEAKVDDRGLWVKAMLNKSIEWGLIDHNPIKSVGKMAGPQTKPLEFLTEQDIDSLLQAATSNYRSIFIAFLRTGLRKNELVYLEWNDIDFSRRQIRVINKKSHSPKRNKERFIPIDDVLMKILKCYFSTIF